MSAAPVDVLAVMELQAYRFRAARLSREIRDCADRELREARAAVAELIEAANRAAVAAVRGDDNRPGTIRNQDLDALRAALARVKGVQS